MSVSVALAVILCSCNNKEALVPGTWTSTSFTVTLNPDKTWKGSKTGVTMAGTWRVDGDDVIMTPETVLGQPIASVKGQMKQMADQRGGQSKSFFDDIDKPDVMKLSDDGKTMTTDKAKDTNSGPGMTFTKK